MTPEDRAKLRALCAAARNAGPDVVDGMDALVQRLRAYAEIADTGYELAATAADAIASLRSALAAMTSDRDDLTERCNNLSDDAESELKEAYAAIAVRGQRIVAARAELLDSIDGGTDGNLAMDALIGRVMAILDGRDYPHVARAALDTP